MLDGGPMNSGGVMHELGDLVDGIREIRSYDSGVLESTNNAPIKVRVIKKGVVIGEKGGAGGHRSWTWFG
jgi:hypothetical protein